MALEKIPAAGLEAGSVNATAIAVNSIPSSRLTTTGVVANSYGNSSQIPVVTIDSAGRITNASTTAVAGVTGFSYEGANNTFSITTGDGSTFKANISANSIAALALGSSGVVANVYGNATAIPVITIDEDGRISNATTTSVSGVTGVSYTAANSTLTVSTSISNYTAPLTAGNSSVQGLLKVVDGVANGSTDVAASANSVKTAYELASNAVSNATSYAATAYSNAVSQATTLAGTAYSNAVSQATTLAGTAYSNAVATAAADATSKSDTAYSNAVSQATTLAGAAYSNAVSVAASDATTKANTAYSNAVSVAASDATTKANTAYSNAVSQATTLAGTAYTNAVSQATTLAGNAYSNATSYADTKAGTAYSNATTFASNADNISSGTLSGARIQANNGIIGNTSGVFVRAGTGVTVNATGVHTNQDISNTANVTFGYMTITGNLVVQGTTTTVNTVNLSVQDNMIYLNSNNTVANPDLGFAGNYNDGTYHHAGFFRDATDARWKVFDNYLPEPDATAYIDTSNTSFQLANFQANVVYANLTGNVTGNVSGSANSSTYVGGNTAGDLRSYSDTVAGTAYSNAIAYSSSNSYVNSTFLKLSGGTMTGSVANASFTGTVVSTGSIHANGTGGSTGGYFGTIKVGYGAAYGTIERTDSDLYLQYNNVYNVYTGYGGGFLYAYNSTRSPIFYDSDNTGYYVNPSSSSNIGSLTSNSNLNLQTGTGDAVYHQIQSTNSIATYAYLRLTTTSGDGYLIRNRATGNSVTDKSLYLWNDPGPIEFVPNGNVSIRTTLSTTGILSVATDIRSPLFYDSDNTGYYVDPASGSNLYGTLVNTGGTAMTSGWNRSMMLSANYPVLVWNSGNTTYSGIGVDYTNAPSRFYFWINGTSSDLTGTGTIAMSMNSGNYVTATGSFRAPIFYDSDDTGYYSNPSGFSRYHSLLVGTAGYPATPPYGGLVLGDINSDYKYVSGWSTSAQVGVMANCADDWEFVVHDYGVRLTSVFLYWGNGNDQILMGRDIGWGASYVQAAESFRAPLFYDSDDTGYYLNAGYSTGGYASTHRSGMLFGPNSTWGAYLLVGGDGKYAYGTNNTSVASIATTNGNMHIDAASGAATYINYYDGVDCGFYAGDSSGVYVFKVFATSNYSQGAGSIRAPLFYDSDDTTYYTNPAGSSYIKSLSTGGNLASTTYPLYAESGQKYLVGLRNTAAANSGYYWWLAHDDDLIFHRNGSGDRFNFTGAGVGTATASWRAPIFYDSIDSSYYVNPNSSSVLSTLGLGGATPDIALSVSGAAQLSGYTYLGGTAGSAGSWSARMYSSGGATYLNTSSFRVDRTGYGGDSYYFYMDTAGNSFASASLRAPIFYDSDNTAYYLDAANSASAGALSLNGGITFGIANPYLTASSYIIVPGGAYFNSGTVYITSNLQARGGVGNDAAAALVLTGGASGYTEINGSTRSPIYYDLSDTTFHTDPAGVSSQKTILIGYSASSPYVYDTGSTGYITFGTTSDPTNYSILTELESYNGNYSKLRFKWYTGIQHYASNYYGGHRFYDINGTQYFGIGVGPNANWSYSIYSHRAPIFYDLDDTNYYIDASSSSGSRLSHLYIGDVAGSNDGSWNARAKVIGSSHARLDVVSNSDSIITTMYSHTGQGVGRIGMSSNHPLALMAESSSIGGYVYSGSIRSPIFYDSDNTSYYADIAGTSAFNAATVYGQWYFRSNRNTTSDSPPLQAYSNDAGGAIMAFHRANQYAINFGLDSDNVIRFGGWSASANRLQMDMSGNLTMAGNVTAYSDIRLKENIEVIANAVSKVKQIRGVTYTRNDDENKTKRHAGVIAQEVEVVLPEVVSEDNSGIKNVAYGNMVGLLIEAIKEQQSTIERLEALVNSLINKTGE